MKRVSRKNRLSFKSVFVIVLAVITLLLLLAAVITLNKILLLGFGISLFTFWGFILVDGVLLPALRKK